MPQLGLGIIGNGTIASLIDIDGRQRWFCFPRLDGDPLFNALVNDDDPATGFMDVILQGATKRKQIYLRNTAVLETIIADDSGASIRIIDFAPRFTRFGRVFCPPMLIRRIEPVAGRCPIKVRMRPTFNYVADKPCLVIGSNHLRFVVGGDALRVTTDMPVSYLAEEVEFPRLSGRGRQST